MCMGCSSAVWESSYVNGIVVQDTFKYFFLATMLLCPEKII